MKKEISEILPYLYLGRYQDSLEIEGLSRLGVTHILNVMESAKFEEGAQFVKCHVAVSDFGDSNLSELVVRCGEFIETARQSNGKVFLHCSRGQNRSPSIATGYLMRYHGMVLKEAFYWVRQRRPQFAPHENYLRQLQEMEQGIYGRISLNENDEPLSIQEISRRIAKDINE